MLSNKECILDYIYPYCDDKLNAFVDDLNESIHEHTCIHELLGILDFPIKKDVGLYLSDKEGY